MNWFQKLLKKAEPPKWEYAGCVTATTTLVDNDGNATPGGTCRGDYLLEERQDGKRRFKLVGYPGSSAAANYRLACVEAWVRGANLPDHLLDDIDPPKYQKPKPVQKQKAELIVFPGGKNGPA